MSKMTCPQCGSDHVDRDEVDIGVGVQCGPWGCFDCGWTEGQEPERPPAYVMRPDDDPDGRPW